MNEIFHTSRRHPCELRPARNNLVAAIQPRSLAEKTGDAYQSFSGEPGVKGTPGF